MGVREKVARGPMREMLLRRALKRYQKFVRGTYSVLLGDTSPQTFYYAAFSRHNKNICVLFQISYF